MPVPIFARIPVHVLPIGAFLLAATLQPAAAAVLATGIVAGHRVEAVLVNRPGAPACIVFENGSRATVDSWNKVIDALPAAVSIFAYNRPGYGNSETTATPRDGSTIVEELRTALQQQGLKPPYILVGHSLGGLYRQLFARRHPDEVGGLVLVDAVYPGVIKKPQDFPLLTRAAKRLFFSSTVNDKIDAIYQTGEQVAALPAIDDKPVVQLFNRPKGATAVPVDFGVVNVDKQTAAAVKAMYPRATRIVLDSDHQIQSQNAAEVAAAINTVVQAAAK